MKLRNKHKQGAAELGTVEGDILKGPKGPAMLSLVGEPLPGRFLKKNLPSPFRRSSGPKH